MNFCLGERGNNVKELLEFNCKVHKGSHKAYKEIIRREFMLLARFL